MHDWIRAPGAYTRAMSTETAVQAVPKLACKYTVCTGSAFCLIYCLYSATGDEEKTRYRRFSLVVVLFVQKNEILYS